MAPLPPRASLSIPEDSHVLLETDSSLRESPSPLQGVLRVSYFDNAAKLVMLGTTNTAISFSVLHHPCPIEHRRNKVVLPGSGSAVNGWWTGRNGVAVGVLCKPRRRPAPPPPGSSSF